MQLRSHQAELAAIVDRIIEGEPIHTITLYVVPGGGKSTVPMIVSKLIDAGLADAIAWIVPRKSLQDQGERDCLDPYFRRLFNHSLIIRSSTNESNPCRGTKGWVSTYQALGVDDNQTAFKDFLKKRYILILDETHHICADDSAWQKALYPLVSNAKYRIFMTGTLSRGDNRRIAFLPYVEDAPKVFKPCPSEAEGHAYIRYGRTAALMEQAIIPMRFFLSDGRVEWETKSGKKKSGKLSEFELDNSAALFTALNTEFAHALLQRGLAHWLNHKKSCPSSKLLVVTSDYKHALEYTATLKKQGFYAKIATSHDSPMALKNIKEFKYGKLDILVSIAMAYEGLSVLQISHIISLTRIRTVPWIMQMVSRAVRIDPSAGPYESQLAYIFAPDDPLFAQVVEEIQREQLPLASGEDKEEKGARKSRDEDGEPEPWINPLAGEITGNREISLYGGMNGHADHPGELTTITDQEEDLLKRIERHVARFAFENRYKVERINAEIKGYFGKARRELTIRELEACLKYVETAYPLNGRAPVVRSTSSPSPPRGTGKRVPTKAQRWLFGENG